MQALPLATVERLQQLPMLRATWQGDVRSIHSRAIDPRARPEAMQACVVWMDTTQPALRALEPVFEEAGYGAIVRVLLQAIEQPHGQLPPGRPQKIVVCDRELQFFLRGALQGLDIKIEYTAQLPLIDSVVTSLEHHQPDPHPIPSAYVEPLIAAVSTVWDDAVWEILAEHEILAIHLNQWDLQTLYLSALGMGGMEMGLLLYRSLDSLERFRHQAIDINTKLEFQKMQEAFLNQDCLFVTFDDDDNDDGDPFEIDDDDEGTVVPELGSIHPLEGLRNHLSDAESLALIVVLEALHRFVKKHRRTLINAVTFPRLSNSFRIPSPIDPAAKPIVVQIETLPDVTSRLLQLIEQDSPIDAPSQSPIDALRNQLPNLPLDLEEEYPDVLAMLLSAAGASGNPSQPALAQPPFLNSAEPTDELGDLALLFQARNAQGTPKTDWIPEGSLLGVRNNITWEIHDILPPSLLVPLQDIATVKGPAPEPATPNPKGKAKATTKGRKRAAAEPKVIRSRGLPLILLQTSQPKAKNLLRQFEEWGNPVCAGFISLYDAMIGDPVDVLLIRTDRRQMLVFDTFWHDDPAERHLKEHWYDRTKAAGKRCALVIAKGVTGQQRGMPGIEEMVQIYDLHALTPEEMQRLLRADLENAEIGPA